MTSTHEIHTSQTAAPVLAQATEPYPGLRIYQQPNELRRPNDTYTWRLGHHSGYAIVAFEYPGDADNAAWAIHTLTDWTRPADTIRAELDGETVRNALESSPGILLTRSSGATP